MTYDPAEVRAAQEHFGFARPVLIEKDWHILRAMSAMVATDAAPFQLIFSGGTCLARAHKLIRRMSEDVDFKIVPVDTASISKSQRRKQLAELRDKITAQLQAAGFPVDPADSAQLRSRDDNHYTVYQLQYGSPEEEESPLRPTIQIELNYATLRLRMLVVHQRRHWRLLERCPHPSRCNSGRDTRSGEQRFAVA
ncbi:MAG TPA: nucleotidyl transferase AbiEii/AbiGii toxin family protein [Povalibacter sp.]|uniref:nucleotidyl transferase AbiEii/AbiGii toxin family protein n=1 Tax=Povalibacter sp. TaxID=1962978 RepID=UPI002BA6E6AF|nr:nucleotidyl transferase AbiEii/AbiGii toxin family protein [Povalibacter sp.]HMN44647.1 nucleotidyl transferase AbiEii/AbiGii toxin family protein [Povalibacter sp.]